MKRNQNENARAGHYERPAARIVHTVEQMTVCASLGVTEDYDAGSIWDFGDENDHIGN